MDIREESPNWFDCHGLGFLNIFLYIFVWHTKAETEKVANAVPAKINEITDLWPRPWLWSRALLLFAISFWVLYGCWVLEGLGSQSHLLSGLVIVGSLSIPLSSLIFFFELNKFRTVSLLRVLRYFLVGSIVAIGVTFVFTYVEHSIPEELNGKGFVIPLVNLTVKPLLLRVYLPTFISALFEEFGKTLIIFIFLTHYKKRIYIYQGMLIGACVGAGFSVFESAGYTSLASDQLLLTMFHRNLFAPVCHIAWGALIGGGTMLITDGRLKYTKLFNPKFSLMFLFVAFLHGYWNYANLYPRDTNPNSLAFANSLQLGVVTLSLLAMMIWAGKRQITCFKKQGYLPVEV